MKFNPNPPSDAPNESQDPVAANDEYKGLRKRLGVIRDEVKRLDELRKHFVMAFLVFSVSVTAAWQVVLELRAEASAARIELEAFDKTHPAPADLNPVQKVLRGKLETAKNFTEGKVEGGTLVFDAVARLLENVRERSEAVTDTMRAYDAEVELLVARAGVIAAAVRAGKPVPPGKAITATKPLDADDHFRDLAEPLKAPPTEVRTTDDRRARRRRQHTPAAAIRPARTATARRVR